MGFSGIGVWQLLIVLLIVGLVFGTKKLRNVGGDLGSAMKSFRSAMEDVDDTKHVVEERGALSQDTQGMADVPAGAHKKRKG